MHVLAVDDGHETILHAPWVFSAVSPFADSNLSCVTDPPLSGPSTTSARHKCVFVAAFLRMGSSSSRACFRLRESTRSAAKSVAGIVHSTNRALARPHRPTAHRSAFVG